LNVAAIDPGNDGAIAIKVPLGVFVEPREWSDPSDVIVLLKQNEVGRVIMEDVLLMAGVGMPKNWKTSCVNWGRMYQAMLDAGIGVVVVQPSAWKKYMKLTAPKGSTPKEKKQIAIDACKALFPGVSLKRTEKCKNDHDGMAEALLMLEYGIREGVLR